jgi:hypothetical protein
VPGGCNGVNISGTRSRQGTDGIRLPLVRRDLHDSVALGTIASLRSRTLGYGTRGGNDDDSLVSVVPKQLLVLCSSAS